MSIYLKRRRKSKFAIYSLAAVRISDLCDVATPDLTRHDKYTRCSFKHRSYQNAAQLDSL